MTRSFAAVERFFERLLERPSARLFRTPIQPEQLQRQLERAMEAGRVSRSDRSYVPNRYRVLLHPDDLAPFQDDLPVLQADLADAILRRARVRGYRLVARPEVVMVPSDRVGAGQVEVFADPLDPGVVRSAAAGLRTVELEGPRPPRPPLPGTAPVPIVDAHCEQGPAAQAAGAGPAATAAPPLPDGTTQPPSVARAPERMAALVEIRSRNGQPWAFVFRGGVVRIGRGSDNEIVLPDDRVSRRHGQLTSRQGTLVYTDLSSSNGSQVNGAPIREIALGVGDVVRVGNSTLTIRPGG